MTKRIISIGVGVVVALVLLVLSYRGYINQGATGRPYWWFMLRLLLAAAAMASVVLLAHSLRDHRLKAITGFRAVLGILLVVVPQIFVIQAGVTLDDYAGFDLSFTPALSFTALAVSIRMAAMLRRKGLAPQPQGNLAVSASTASYRDAAQLAHAAERAHRDRSVSP